MQGIPRFLSDYVLYQDAQPATDVSGRPYDPPLGFRVGSGVGVLV